MNHKIFPVTTNGIENKDTHVRGNVTKNKYQQQLTSWDGVSIHFVGWDGLPPPKCKQSQKIVGTCHSFGSETPLGETDFDIPNATPSRWSCSGRLNEQLET